ncbi:uncharacterized protein [Garra rufa]|uniref:uncharacterized protein n=1 Tax=Garra rufa TaxID=137080 RepID=UPI003CCECA9E
MEKEDTAFRLSIPHHKRIAIALWKLATNSEYRTISHLFGVGRTTVWRCTKEFCVAAADILLAELIPLPSTESLAKMAEYFERRWGVPQCVGAIDGSHIPIIAPREHHNDYVNRKGWHSIILQAVVDGKGQFWNICVGRPGSLHDARVLRLSKLWDLLNTQTFFPAHTRHIGGENLGYYIIGDAAYPAQPWLVKPFTDTGRLTEQQDMFNARISRARVMVETAFGRLKGRWRCLLKRNDCDLDLAREMVVACCILHNLCEQHNEVCRPEWMASDSPQYQQPSTPLPERERFIPEADVVRACLLRHFSHNV